MVGEVTNADTGHGQECDGWMDIYFAFTRMVLEVHLWRGKYNITGWYMTISANL